MLIEADTLGLPEKDGLILELVDNKAETDMLGLATVE